MGFVADLVDTVVSFVGRPLGIYTHDETFTDVQISNLLTVGVANDAAKRSAIRTSGGDAMQYFNTYRTFQRQYKRRYSREFLEALGYAPNSTASTRVIDEALLETHIETTEGYVDVDIEKGVDTYLTLDEKGKYGRQFVTGYDFDTLSVTNAGKVYLYSEVVEVSPTEVILKFVRNYNDSIVDNLTDNYSYDDVAGTVIINTEVYNVGVISSVINGNDQYETVCTHQGATLPDETILTPVERYNENYINALFDNEVTYAEYRVTSGEVSNALRYYIAAADTLSIYVTADVDVTTIVTMKEDNVLANNNGELKRILKKLNLSYDDLIDSIKNPDLDSAYLMTALDTNIDNDAHNMVMFRMFDLVPAGSGNVTISINKLNLRYSFTIQKTTITGTVGAVGSYSRSGISTDGITLYYQGSATEYQEIVISDYSCRYTLSGQTLDSDFTSLDNRLVLPLDIFNSLRYRDWVDIYEHSLCMLGYAVETIEVKWYETAAFGFVLKIVAIVIAVFSMGKGVKLSAMLWKMAAAYVITQVAMVLAEAIGGPIGALIGAIAAVYAMYQVGIFDGTSGNDFWLKAASEGINTFNQAIQHEIESITTNAESVISSIQDSIDEIREKNKEFEEEDSMYFNFQDASEGLGRPNKAFQTIEQYVNSIVNTEWLVDGSWMYDIDGEIASRNSVYVG